MLCHIYDCLRDGGLHLLTQREPKRDVRAGAVPKSHNNKCAATTIAGCTHEGMTMWLPTPTADKVSCNAATVLMW